MFNYEVMSDTGIQVVQASSIEEATQKASSLFGTVVDVLWDNSTADAMLDSLVDFFA